MPATNTVSYRARQNVARWLLPKGAMVIKNDDSPEARAALSKRLDEVERITERGMRRALDEGQAIRDQARLANTELQAQLDRFQKRRAAACDSLAVCARAWDAKLLPPVAAEEADSDNDQRDEEAE